MISARRRGSKRTGQGGGSYWMSYSDMMAALLLMFILLLFVSFNRYMTLQATKEAELADKQTQLQLQADELSQAQQSLTDREAELATIRSLLNTKQLELDQQQLELENKNAALEESAAELEQSTADLEQSLAQLILQQAQIDEQQRLLALNQQDIDELKAQLDAYSQELEDREILLDAQTAALLIEQSKVTDLQTLLTERESELNQQAAMIEELVGVRTRIIRQLSDALSKAGLNVSVDMQTGSITMDSTVFFDSNSATLKQAGRDYLAQILPVYFATLMEGDNFTYVSEIIVEGHTDSDGTYEHNLELSQRRAQAVVNYCFNDSFTGLDDVQKETLRTVITANGRSESQPILDAQGNEDKQASRRVEIKFRLKDAEMIDGLQEIFSRMDTQQ